MCSKVVLGWGGEKSQNGAVHSTVFKKHERHSLYFGALFGSFLLEAVSVRISPFLATANVLLVKRTRGS